LTIAEEAMTRLRKGLEVGELSAQRSGGNETRWTTTVGLDVRRLVYAAVSAL